MLIVLVMLWFNRHQPHSRVDLAVLQETWFNYQDNSQHYDIYQQLATSLLANLATVGLIKNQ